MRKKVQCWIFSTDAQGSRLCLVLKTNRARGEFWQPVTGSVEEGEDFLAAAGRESAEETALAFEGAPLDTGYEFGFTSRFGPARERVYALTVQGVPKPTLDPHEHQEHKWVSPSEALQLLRFPSNIEGLRRAHRLVFGTEP